MDDNDDASSVATGVTTATERNRLKSYAKGVSKEFFNDLVATPVDHLTAHRGGLGDSTFNAAQERRREQRATGDADLNIAHLSEALHLQRRTTEILHEVERTAALPPVPQMFSKVCGVACVVDVGFLSSCLTDVESIGCFNGADVSGLG